jgi:hypothetical protein
MHSCLGGMLLRTSHVTTCVISQQPRQAATVISPVFLIKIWGLGTVCNLPGHMAVVGRAKVLFQRVLFQQEKGLPVRSHRGNRVWWCPSVIQHQGGWGRSSRSRTGGVAQIVECLLSKHWGSEFKPPVSPPLKKKKSSKPAWANSWWEPILKKSITKKGLVAWLKA